jgi:hypothetical protein
MARLKFEMWPARPESRGYISRFTDGRGRFTQSWWSSPPDSIDHVGPEYLRNPHRHPNVANKRHDTFVKRRFKEEALKLRPKAIDTTEPHSEAEAVTQV